MDSNMLTQFSNQLTKKTVYLDLPENMQEDYIFNLILFLTSMNAVDRWVYLFYSAKKDII